MAKRDEGGGLMISNGVVGHCLELWDVGGAYRTFEFSIIYFFTASSPIYFY